MPRRMILLVLVFALLAGGQLLPGVSSAPVLAAGGPAAVEVTSGVDEQSGTSGPNILLGGEGNHYCRITRTSTVECWGANNHGQLGNGAISLSQTTPVPVGGLTGVVSIAVGGGHTCALLKDGTVKCWGLNDHGQLGNGTTADSLVPATVSGLSGVTAIGAGNFLTCALLATRRVNCWGWNQYGQVGDDTTTDRTTPVEVSGITTAVGIAVGVVHACAVLEDSTAACWGDNSYGELGDGTTTERTKPVPVSDLTDVVSLAAGFQTCALLKNQGIKCWGMNYYGQIGDGTKTDRTKPVDVVGLSGVSMLATGSSLTCAALAGGTVKCWGANGHGQLGDGTTDEHLQPADVEGLGGVAALAAGGDSVCALLTDGSVRCWGGDQYGQLGEGMSANRLTPASVLGLSTASTAALGFYHACALRSDGTVMCWGYNGNGQVGDGTTTERLTPVPVLGLTGVTALATGGLHTCALLNDSTVKCWGDNYYGELGDGTRTGRLEPVAVAGLSGVVAITAGNSHTCALLADTTMKCWGYNTYGQLGNGAPGHQELPVVVVGLSGAKSITAGYNHTCALLTDGTARCWGANTHGQLGDGTTTDRYTAVPVTGLAGAASLTAGEGHTCALLAGSGVSCWGWNSSGELGDGTTTDRLAPVPVIGITGAASVAGGRNHACVSVSGSVACWGSNIFGQLGDGTTNNRSTPTAISGLSGITSVSAGLGATCAIITGGDMRCWGMNGYGQLGTGDVTYRTVPVYTLTQDYATVTDENGKGVEGAEVWVYRSGDRLPAATPASDRNGHIMLPLLQAGDRLAALLQVKDGNRPGWPYRVYITSLVDGTPYTAAQAGEHPTLQLRKTSPLFLFDLVVSMEWCDGLMASGYPQQQYVRNGLEAAASYLFDVTDGQFTFGSIDVHDCGENWQDADIQIMASSNARPWANTGGVVSDTLQYTNPTGITFKFAPGHVRIGRTWTRSGVTNPSMPVPPYSPLWFDNDDSFRALVHEFLHYAGFVFDEYYYVEPSTGVVTAKSCTDPSLRQGDTDKSYWLSNLASIMYWPYNASELDQSGSTAWSSNCEETEQNKEQNESSWDTLRRIYADTATPARWTITTPRDRANKQPLPGPLLLNTFPDLPSLSPLLTHTDLSNPLVRVQWDGGTPAAGQQAQVFLVRKTPGSGATSIVDEGSPDGSGRILLPGAQAGDVALAVSWDGTALAVAPKPLSETWMLTLKRVSTASDGWTPLVTAQPVIDGAAHMTGVAVSVCGVSGTNLYAMVVPVGGAAMAGFPLTLTGAGCYGAVHAFAGQQATEAHLWICDLADNSRTTCDPRDARLAVVTYATGEGSPGSHGRSYAPTTSNGYCAIHLGDGALTQDAPVLFMTSQATVAPPEGQRYVSAPCLVSLPTDVGLAKPSSLSMYYNATQVLDASGRQLNAWRWDAATRIWSSVSNTQTTDIDLNFLAVPVTQTGLYVLTEPLLQASQAVAKVDNTTVVNVIQPAVTATINDAFPAACQLQSVYSVDAGGTVQRYVAGAPAYVNTLMQIQPGQVYYVQVGSDCVVGAGGLAAAAGVSIPKAPTFAAALLPSTYYGTVQKAPGFPVPPGNVVEGRIKGQTFGRTHTFSYQGETVYVMDVAGDDPQTQGVEGGKPQDVVSFFVAGTPAQPAATWLAGTANEVELAAPDFLYRQYMPLVSSR